MSLQVSNLCVVDTGVLIELSRLGYLEVLPQLFKRVLIPPAVLLELQSLDVPAWLELTQPDVDLLKIFYAETNLGRGETEALALAFVHSAWVLLDDRKARRFAKSKEIANIGTLGLLILVHQRGWQVRSARDDLDLLAKGLWITQELLEAALLQIEN